MVERSVYRRDGERNGKVVDPVSLRAGVVADGWLPQMARAMAHHVQGGTAREAEVQLHGCSATTHRIGLPGGGCALLNTENAALDILHELRASGREDVRVGDTQPVHKAITYLDSHWRRMNYAAGLPIESGNVEGNLPNARRDRMKRAGSRWKVPTGRHILHLRALATSDRWTLDGRDGTHVAMAAKVSPGGRVISMRATPRWPALPIPILDSPTVTLWCSTDQQMHHRAPVRRPRHRPTTTPIERRERLGGVLNFLLLSRRVAAALEELSPFDDTPTGLPKSRGICPRLGALAVFADRSCHRLFPMSAA